MEGLRLCHVTGSCDSRRSGSSLTPTLQNLMTTPPQRNQPPGLPHGHGQEKIAPWSEKLPGWGSRDRFECLLPSKADFYQLMAGGDGGPLAMDVGACPP